MPREHIHFVTGRLAQHALSEILPPLAKAVKFDYSVDVLPITVAALMTPEWIAKHISVPSATTKILIPGYCEGPTETLQALVKIPIERGPRDLRQLPQHFSRPPLPDNYGSYDVQIIAEINHCPQLTLDEILATAKLLRQDGADLIDLGCEPGQPWQNVADTVLALRDEGLRVSIDSLNPKEIEPAIRVGAELVLSVNSSNREAALDWGIEVVVIPDDPKTLAGLDETIDLLARNNVPLRIDPILEPISFGFAESLGRYLEIRRRYPDAEMMMGIGNLTELTDADSAGINTMLLGFCQELGIRSVLTTQVINWARSSVKECDLARRLMYHAVNQQVLPKHLEPKLIMLRDEEIVASALEQIADLAADIRDNNYRIFVAEGEIHLISRELHLHNTDPMAIMDELSRSGPDGSLPKNLDASHTLYLGYEMCKAKAALTLGKTYEQDESLNWGLATQPENRHYLKRKPRGDQS
jgi:dihydropteroate synthase-like protein